MRNNSGDTWVVRYSVSADPDAADPASGAMILSVAQRFNNHNGGALVFGPGQWEEIDVVQRVAPNTYNFGWNLTEGARCLGRDADGELYELSDNGTVYRLVSGS